MSDENNAAIDGENRKLQDIFLDGWNQYEFLDETTIDSNSLEYQVSMGLAGNTAPNENTAPIAYLINVNDSYFLFPARIKLKMQ